jgi:hypothetical protein
MYLSHVVYFYPAEKKYKLFTYVHGTDLKRCVGLLHCFKCYASSGYYLSWSRGHENLSDPLPAAARLSHVTETTDPAIMYMCQICAGSQPALLLCQ